MLDRVRINRTLDFALRVGEVLLSSGAGAADASATMQSITFHAGLRGVEVDVTFTRLSMSYQDSLDDPPLIHVRLVKHRDIDYNHLTLIDHLVRDLLVDEIDLEQARNRLNRVVSSGHRLPRWAVTAGLGVLGLGIGLMFANSWVVVLVAFAAAVGIDLLKVAMARRRLPSFYQQVGGGLLATLFAVGLAATPVHVNPSVVVTASIVLLLSGVGFMGAVQDALTGFYITSGARILEAMLLTAGIIAGVSGGLGVAERVGVEIALNPGVTGLAQLPLMTSGAALAAAAFAFSSYAPYRSLLPIAVVAGVGEAIFYLINGQGFGRTWATAVAAVTIGAVSYAVAGRMRVPPLAVVVPAIVPLLPGLSIYRGLSLITAGDSFGILAITTAAGIAIALAAGVILGEYLAQPLKREARRLESRLAGPRLVGPHRTRSVRHEAAQPGR